MTAEERPFTLGVAIPTVGSLPLDVGITTMAATAEDAGAASLWVTDHLLMVRQPRSPYPYSQDGAMTWDPESAWFEALSCCSWLAASTERATVGTSVLVLPQRHPVEVAKTCATIDALSGGRLILGVGAGWLEEEFEVLGWSYRERGRRLDEAIDVLRACWTGDPGPFEGEFFTIPEGTITAPVPARGRLPVLVGGMGDRPLKRAATRGDGWLAINPLARFNRNDLEERVEHLRRYADAAGRPQPKMVLKAGGVISSESVESVAEKLLAARDLGFHEVIVDLPWDDADAAAAVFREVSEATAAG